MARGYASRHWSWVSTACITGVCPEAHGSAAFPSSVLSLLTFPHLPSTPKTPAACLCCLLYNSLRDPFIWALKHLPFGRWNNLFMHTHTPTPTQANPRRLISGKKVVSWALASAYTWDRLLSPELFLSQQLHAMLSSILFVCIFFFDLSSHIYTSSMFSF